ncbi:hypothetical protein [Corallococcus macrosporus]|uniref:Uncharacterized protein n=1 Tax=Myxococcus fulvus (strain ATCC BAA-855 / HW-1) TaxID=483219 RepID=F8CKN8_MYXFH|nr:hypothetical protein [Corallococcus macrosporus]AEI62703.1 hypothetical protein LILAB_03890 [Corallococcus macrosporus]
MSLESLLPMVLAAIALVLVVTAYWMRHQRRNRAWRQFAALHDWSCIYSLGTWEVAGLHRGRQFRMRTERHQSNGPGQPHTYLCTVVRLEFGQALPPDVRIRPEGIADKLLKVIGQRDEDVGDAKLDALLNLEYLSDETRDILRAPGVRQQLMTLCRRFTDFTIEGARLTAMKRGMPDSVEALESLVAPALLLSDALHEVAGEAHGRGAGQPSSVAT